MTKPTSAPIWLELNIDRVGKEIRISARGSRGEHVAPRSLGMDCDSLRRFAEDVERAAVYRKSLAPEIIPEAQRILQAVLDGELGRLFGQLGEAAGGTLLVRMMAHDPDLQAIPWEALYDESGAGGFWGTSTKVLFARGTTNSERTKAREIDDAVRILAIAPTGDASLENLRRALDRQIANGQVEWLDPIVGRDVQPAIIRERLSRSRVPHIVHFIGHGGMHKGEPALRLGDDIDGDEKWITANVITQGLGKKFYELRLIVLDMCEGAKSSMFASTAEKFVQAGANAVVAHLWPVRADVGQRCSTTLYQNLIEGHMAGDIAAALNAARLVVLGTYDSSAEAMSPVLYLRGTESRIFDFVPRRSPPLPPFPPPSERSNVPPSLSRIIGAKFSLILGDRWTDERPQLHEFRRNLQERLGIDAGTAFERLPMGTLTQWFALRRGTRVLENEFQRTFKNIAVEPPIIATIAPLLCAGVHTTLLRKPWLEMSLAKHQPNRTIFLIVAGDDGVLVMKRGAGSSKWEELNNPPTNIDLTNDILILRPYGGYTLEENFTRPLLTEDDYCRELHDFWRRKEFPADFAHSVMTTMGRHPTLMLGLSMHTSNHRMLLRSLLTRGIPNDSLAVVEQDAAENADTEREVWQSGRGLPRHADGVEVIAMHSQALCAALRSITEGGHR